MKRLFLNTSKATFLVTNPAGEKKDQQGNQRKTKDGVPMWTVQLLVKQEEEKGSLIDVTLANTEKPKVNDGQMVTLEDLEVIPWNHNGSHGNAFRASAIRPASAVKTA